MEIRPLHPEFGVEVIGVDLSTVTAEVGYPEIRDLFERHSLLLFRRQQLDDEVHLRFARLFGPLEDREDRPEPKMTFVSNEDGGVGAVVPESDRRMAHLKANFLWHTDSTFLPVPALANVLRAKTLPSTGGNTEFVSTRAGLARLDPDLRAKLEATVFRHRYAHSRRKVAPEIVGWDLLTKWPDTAWRGIWRNPATGAPAAYVASHVFGAVGLPDEEGEALAEEAIEAMTVPDAVYSHAWQPGDVLIWDERATLHRGTPWPYEERRALASICVSVTEADGLASIRP